MRAILDEQLSPQIAVLLRKVGYDVDAVADRADLIGRSDRVVFEVACREGRAAVTNNIKDFRPLAAESSRKEGRTPALSWSHRHGHAPVTLSPPLPARSRTCSATIPTGLARANAGSAR